MPVYSIQVRYTEVSYYRGTSEFEADSREEAEDMALEAPWEFCESHDSETQDMEIYECECTSGDDPDDEEAKPKQLERNLPEWF